MESTLERLEAPDAESAEPGSPPRQMPLSNPNALMETPSQALGRKLANAVLNSVPSGVSFSRSPLAHEPLAKLEWP